jgi:hypothetical protein
LESLQPARLPTARLAAWSDFVQTMTKNGLSKPKNDKIRNKMMKAFSICTMAAALVVLSTGCGRDTVKVYHVDANDTANPNPPPAVMPTTMPNRMPAPDTSGQPSLQYTLPAGWEKKVPTQMRVASFGISQDGKSADVSVIPLAGMAGTDPANVNRWRG